MFGTKTKQNPTTNIGRHVLGGLLLGVQPAEQAQSKQGCHGMVEVLQTPWSYNVKGRWSGCPCISCMVWLSLCEWLTVHVSTEQHLFLCCLLFIDTVLEEGEERGGVKEKSLRSLVSRCLCKAPLKHSDHIVPSHCRNTFFSFLFWGGGRGYQNPQDWEVGIKKKKKMALWNLFSPATVFRGRKQSRIKKLVQINRKTCGEMITLSLLHWQVAN